MVRQTRAERREKFRSRKLKPDAERLRAEIEGWVKQNHERLAKLYDYPDSSFPYLAHLRDRTIDIVEPIAAILEIVYAETPELNARRMELLVAVGLTRKDGEEFVADHRILRELARLANADDPLIGNASELAARCELNPKPTEHEMAATLRRYEFENRSIRVGESIRHRYELTRTELAEICARFDSRAPEGENVPTLVASAGDTD